MKRDLTYKLLSVIPALLCAVLLTAMHLLSVTPTATAVVAALACALSLCIAVLLHKRVAPNHASDSAAVTFATSIVGLLLLVCFAISAYAHYFAPITERLAVINGAVTMLGILFALLASAYFLASALAPSLLASNAVRLAGAITPILYCAFRILGDFIATGTMPLADDGGYHIIGMIATMLFLLCEGKQLAKGGKTWTYLASGQIAIMLNLAYHIPLFASFAEASAFELMHSALFVAFTVYIAVRLLTVKKQEEPKEQEPETQESKTQEPAEQA